MQLTQENARQYLGKKLTGGLFHYWPLTVHEINGKFYAADRNHTMFPVPSEQDPANMQIYFNHVEE